MVGVFTGLVLFISLLAAAIFLYRMSNDWVVIGKTLVKRFGKEGMGQLMTCARIWAESTKLSIEERRFALEEQKRKSGSLLEATRSDGR